MLSRGYYIDLIFPASDHYLNDPVPENLGLTDTEKSLIIGGEATMWSELNLIESWLKLWQKNHSRLIVTIRKSPILDEIESLSEDLSRVSIIGLEALSYIKKRRIADSGWLAYALNSLAESKIPRGQTELMIITPVEKLVNYAGRQ